MTQIAVIGRSSDSIIANAIPIGWEPFYLDGKDEENDFRALHTSGFALFCMSATAGFDVAFLKYWKALEELIIPRAVVVTDLDNGDADFDESCALIARILGEEILPTHLVLHEEDGSPAALIDLFSLQVSQGEVFSDAEPEVVELVLDARLELLQEIATSIDDEVVSNQLLQGITPSPAVLHRALTNAVATATFIPVLTSAENNSLGQREMRALLADVLANSEFSPLAASEIGDIEGFLNRYIPTRQINSVSSSELALSIEFPDEYLIEVDREISRAQATPYKSIDHQGVSLREFEISTSKAGAFLNLLQNACDYNAIVQIASR